MMFDVQRGVAAFLEGLEERLPAVVHAADARQRATVSELAVPADTDVADVAAQALSVGVELALVAMRSPSAAPREAPEALARMAGLAAQRDIPLTSILRSLRSMHAVILDHLIEQAERTGTPLEVVETTSRRLFWFLDALVPLVTEEHAAECRRLGSRPDQGRATQIRAVLDGADRLELAYPLVGPHLGIVLHGPQTRAHLRALLDHVRVPLLATEAADHTVWAWLACDLCEEDVVKILRGAWQGGCFVGVSGHERGVAGFRATHRKARMALRLGRRRGSPVTTFGAVALEALAFGGEQMAREFVDAELGPLLREEPRVAVIRDTLVAYFAHGSAAAAARDLGVSERAVVYRLRHAEALLGRPLTARRAELETALRLHGMFASRLARAAV